MYGEPAAGGRGKSRFGRLHFAAMKRSHRNLLFELGLAVLGGAAWGLCFGVTSRPWLGWVALVPLLYLLGDARRSRWRLAVLALVHGVMSWLVSMPWIPPTVVTFGHLAPALAWVLFLLLALYLSLYQAAFAVLARSSATRGAAWAIFVPPAAWVAVEWVRGTPLGSFNFPWNLSAYAWVDVPGALPLSAWIGPYGIGYLVLLTNAAFAWSLRRRSAVPGLLVAGSVAVLLLVGARFSRPAGDAEPRLRRPVRIVQPNQEILAEPGAGAEAGYRRLVERSEAECRAEGTLLVWPESAAWPHSWEGSAILRRDLHRLAERGCETILNTPRFESNEVYYNSAMLVSRAGPLAVYDKRFLVPYGEQVPLAGLFPFIGHLARMSGTYTPGKEVALLPWGEERLGLGICYEVVFPEAMAEEARAGATLLVNISNDAWYGDSSAPRQLFRAARFRAAENRRLMLRAALTGISGVVGRRGEVLARIELGRPGMIAERVAGSSELTPYARFPWIVPLLSALVVVSAIFRAWTKDRRKRHAIDGAC